MLQKFAVTYTPINISLSAWLNFSCYHPLTSPGHTPRNLLFFLTNLVVCSQLTGTQKETILHPGPSHGSNGRNDFDFRTIPKPKEFASNTWLGSFDLYLNASIAGYNTKIRRFVKNVYALPET